jgi:GNAT superfamily N-acetyltransferase
MGARAFYPALVPCDEAKDIVIALHKICFPHISETYWDSSAHWWIIKDKTGTPVAFGGLLAATIERAGYLCRAGVIPNARGKGLQRRLIRARLEFADRFALHHVMTDTVYGNCASANNLIAEGFRAFNPVTPWGQDDSSYWIKLMEPTLRTQTPAGPKRGA